MVDISMTDGPVRLAMAAGAYFARARQPTAGRVMLAAASSVSLTYEAADGWSAAGAPSPSSGAPSVNARATRTRSRSSLNGPGARPGRRLLRWPRERTRDEGSHSTTSTTVASNRSSNSMKRSSRTCSANAGNDVEWDSRHRTGQADRFADQDEPHPAGDPAPPRRSVPTPREVLAPAGPSAEEIEACSNPVSPSGPGSGGDGVPVTQAAAEEKPDAPAEQPSEDVRAG